MRNKSIICSNKELLVGLKVRKERESINSSSLAFYECSGPVNLTKFRNSTTVVFNN